MSEEPEKKAEPAPPSTSPLPDFLTRPLPGFGEQPSARLLPDPPDGGPIWFRGADDGFVVDEVPAYLPGGTGEHLYLHIRKRGISTPEVWKRLRSAFGVKEIEIGTAGQKDARGITSQWISVPARLIEPRIAEVEARLGVELLEAKRHNNKLRLGHLRGNRFTCRLDDVVDADVALLRSRATTLAAGGCPNLFGAQRFGHGDRALRDAERFLARPRYAKTKREQFWVSALQSAIFNVWLAARVKEGSWNSAVDGDVLEKRSGAPFECTDPSADALRAAAGEVSATGPLYGRAMRCAQRDALTRESRSLEELGISRDALLAHPSFPTGTRRSARLWAEDVVVDAAGGSCTVAFTLPAGSYASVFLRELVGPRLRDLFFDAPPTPSVEARVSDDD
ncbi:MAG: tRNA pseudouridine(13) synthase TruD [Deltaproteobacteria bacterium]|nr:tRNA pseudouridine(13) synthase TruD [Deltaproteobacteria bacterium]